MEEIEELISDEFKSCFILFMEECYKDDYPRSCEIHNVFGKIEDGHHNCLGCNFADSTEFIADYLKEYESLTNIQQNFTIYILLLYLLVERIEIVLDIIQVPDIYKEKNFKVFQRIRKWANFIKHPKSFILTHHAVYNFKDSGIEWDFTKGIVIDDSFVSQYYKGEKDPDKQKKINKELYEKLKNQINVTVEFPNIYQLTKQICFAFNKFIDVIVNNEVYIEILNDDTTIMDYFEKSN